MLPWPPLFRAALALPAPSALDGPLAGTISGPLGAPAGAGVAALGYAGAGTPGADRLASIPEAEVVDPVTRLRRLIETRQDETAQRAHVSHRRSPVVVSRAWSGRRTPA